MKVNSKVVGSYNGKDIIEYEMENLNGIKVGILNLGGTITKILTKDRNGTFENIVLAYENIEDYILNKSYYGAIVGRTAGRIYKGEITLEGKDYKLNNNYIFNQCHGGNEGFNKRLWQVNTEANDEEAIIRLCYISEDGEENYPGEVLIEASYTLNNKDELEFLVKAKTYETTLVNITNHSYFNLSGGYKEDILEHNLKINVESILELEETSAATGKKLKVCENEAFDFNEGKLIKTHIDSNHEQIKLGKGYDHPFVFEENKEGKITLSHEKSGRHMNIITNQESVVIYTMNYPGEEILQGNVKPRERFGICFETQAPPIGINQCFIEKSILKPYEEYKKYTKYKFY